MSIRLHAFHQSNLSQVKLASASNTSLNPKEKSFNLEGGKRSPVLRTINISLEDKARAALCSFTHLLPQAGMTDTVSGSTDTVGHLRVQTLRGATVLTNKCIYTHANTMSTSVEKVWVVLIRTLEESTVNLNVRVRSFHLELC